MEKLKVFITILDRWTWAKTMCEDYEKAGVEVILIDNDSTYPPCVEWLKNCQYKVEHMGKNEGAWAYFNTDLRNKYKDRFYILSDSDMDVSGVPIDWPEHLMKGLEMNNHSQIWKASLSYEINDLPNNAVTQRVIGHEKGFWLEKANGPFFKGLADVGVVLCDDSKRIPKWEYNYWASNWFSAIRSDRPYTARSLDWYFTPETVREEDIYYWEKTKWYYGWGRKFYEQIVLKLPCRPGF